LQWLKVPLRSFTPNELYIIACVLCCRKIHSWNVKLFLIVASTCSPISPCRLTKLLTSLPYEYQCFPIWSFGRLIRRVHELTKNLICNEVSAVAISVYNKSTFSCLFINIWNQRYIQVSELVIRISMSSWWNTCLFYKHTNKRLTYPSALRNHRV
jgi:hypothetical protein